MDFRSQVSELKRRRTAEKPSAEDLLWQETQAKLGRDPQRYCRFSPTGMEVFAWDADIQITKYFDKHKRMPSGIFVMGDANATSSTQKVAATTAAPTSLLSREQTVDALSRLQKDYNAAVDRADEEINVEDNPYPTEAWAGTPYYDFAVLAKAEGTEHENYIPKSYFINALMTIVGAICGNRMTPASNPNLYAHFYTLLLSTRGGIGKNETITWCKKCFDATGLLYSNGFRQHKNIGAFRGDFGSARGLVDKFVEYPSVLQEYGELSTAIEKFGIAGSGCSFLDANLNLHDDPQPNWSLIAKTRIPETAPKHVNNSILSGTTTARWDAQISANSLETLIQRMNIIPTTETRTAFELQTPSEEAFAKMRQQLMDRIGLLEEYKLVWRPTPEAKALGKEWHRSLEFRAEADSDNDVVDSSETFGRIQVYVHRIISHLALFLADVPVVDGKPVKPHFIAQDVPYVRKFENSDKVWNVEVSAEMMAKAISIAEYLIKAKAEHQPPPGADVRAKMENIIKKWVVRLKYCRWTELKYRANLRRYSSQDSERALVNVERTGLIHVKKNPTEPSKQSDWVVVWIGDGRKTRKWTEKRGQGVM